MNDLQTTSNLQAMGGLQALPDLLAELEEGPTLALVQGELDVGQQPKAILDALNEGMTIVGDRFAIREYYLSELIMAAEIFEGAMLILEPHLVAGGESREIIGTIVIGTVQGDLHDIGKNIFVGLVLLHLFDKGGGGTLDAGVDLLSSALDEGLSLEWVDAGSIRDDVWTVTVGLHGSIAPPSAGMLAEIDRSGLTVAGGEWYIARAVRELGAYLGHQFGCLVPAEIGPESAAIPLAVGAHLGIPIVDGDYIGRAVPEEMQSTYCLYGKQSDMFAGVDIWGNVSIVKEAANTHALERIAKMLALAAYGDVAVATTPLVAGEMKKIVVPGTMTKCLEIGRCLRQARDAGRDPVAATLETIDGWRLLDGTVTRLETEDRDGYLFGQTRIQGTGTSPGQTLDVWFKNENLVSWLNGNPWICSPDLISLLHRDSGRGICNADLQEGDQVVAVGFKGVEGFRSERGLELAGPRHFGFDIDYVPIEELMQAGNR